MKDPVDAHAVAVAGAARPAHLPARARARRADPPARHHHLLHAALRHRARGDRTARAHRHRRHRARMRLTRIHVEPELVAGKRSRAARAGGRAPHARAAPRRRARRSRFFNGAGGEYRGRSSSADGKRCLGATCGAHDAVERESPLQITLLQGVARGERMDLIVQKATELGVTRIVPVLAERSGGQGRREAARAQARALAGRSRSPPASNAAAIACRSDASRRARRCRAQRSPRGSLRCLLAADGGESLAAAARRGCRSSPSCC